MRESYRLSPLHALLGRGAVLATVISLVAISPCGAQEPADEPLLDELQRYFKRKPLSVGALFQTVLDVQPDRSLPGGNGFSIANMRVSIYGELDQGFGYFFQTNFASSPAILDAKLYYRFMPQLRLDAGLFKAPFSRELLTGAGSIDFVNRSQVVTALAPGRQIGAQLGGELGDGTLAYGVGAFNGNAFDGNGNDNDEFLYAARISLTPRTFKEPSGDQLELALNVAYSEDDNVDLGGGFVSGFDGQRALLGVDFRWTRGLWLAAGELIAARLEPSAGPAEDPWGFHLTAGFKLTPNSQLLLRWDSLSPDGVGEDRDFIIAGYNFWPTGATEVQINYAIPTQESLDNHQLLVNAQVAY